MKITKFKKTKSNIYEIILEDNSKYNLYDEIILKSNLLFTKEITLEELNKLLKDNNYYELYYNCLKFLKNKMRSEKEIREKFKSYSKNDLDKVIAVLKKNQYINELDYIKAYINDCINLKIIGPYKIRRDLITLGLKENDINDYLNSFSNDIWKEKINKLVLREVNNNHRYNQIQLKQRIMNNLVNKGFYKEDISDCLECISISIPEGLYEKEYSKLEKKLSRKYAGEELKQEIKKRLRAKGFKEIVD